MFAINTPERCNFFNKKSISIVLSPNKKSSSNAYQKLEEQH